MENIDILREIVVELDMFKKKLVLAIKEQDVKEPFYASKKHYAACKRAALDLKNELTKLTQDSKYKYSK